MDLEPKDVPKKPPVFSLYVMFNLLINCDLKDWTSDSQITEEHISYNFADNPTIFFFQKMSEKYFKQSCWYI